MRLKAFILGSIFVAFSFGVHAQDTATNKADEQVTWSKAYTDVKGAITNLSAALKVGADHVYKVMVQQQVLNAITWLVIAGIGLILVFITWRYLKWFIKSDIDVDDGAGWIVLAIVLVIITLVIFISALTKIDVILTGLNNPEYGAISDILKKLHGNE